MINIQKPAYNIQYTLSKVIVRGHPQGGVTNVTFFSKELI